MQTEAPPRQLLVIGDSGGLSDGGTGRAVAGASD